MSKSTKIIAGAGVAALAIAAVPAVASFAETSQNVKYQVEIENTLSLAVNDADLSYTLTNGGAVQNSTKSTFTAITNNTKGYTVTAYDTDGTSLTSDANDTIAYGTPAVNASAWNLTSTGMDDADTPAAIGVVALTNSTSGVMVDYSKTTTSTEGDTFDITFAASASKNQAAGTYTDTVTYTITANS